MGKRKKLPCIRENGQFIFVSPENRRWVRMPQRVYRKYAETPYGGRLLTKALQEKYQLSQPLEEQENLMRSVYFAVTGSCNMCCSFCTMNSGPFVSREADMSLEEIRDNVLPKILEIKPEKLILTGGEPFVRPDMVEIIKLFGENIDTRRITLQTNGLLMTEDIVHEIASYIGAIEYSIEPLFENKNLLRKMIKIFEICRSEQIPLSFSFVAHDGTAAYLKEALDLCHEFGAYFSLRIVSMLGRAKENHASDRIASEAVQETIYSEALRYVLEKKYYEDQITGIFLTTPQIRKSCGAFGNICAIHADGRVYMCENFKEDRYSFGNIRKDSVPELKGRLREKMNTESLRKEFVENRPKLCRKCKVNYFCTGPCSAVCAENKVRGQDLCGMKKRLLEFNLFYHTQKKSKEENLKKLLLYLTEN